MRNRFLKFAATLVLATVAGASSAGPDARVALAERSALIAAHNKCRLFNDDMVRALSAARAQARGALLRAGIADEEVARISGSGAARGQAVSCTDPTLATAVSRARAGFQGLANVREMRFPGTDRAWQAQRRPDADGWRVVQEVGAADTARARFGLRDHAGSVEFALVANIASERAAPVTGRLFVRNTAMARRPTLGAGGLASRVSSRNVAQVFLARSRRIEPAGKDPATGAARAARVVLVFPDAARGALAGLDPRETVEVLMDPAGPGAPPQRLLIEVGDFAAAAVLFGTPVR
jgi:hypothetical protein